jgi:hypothetical protein
MNAVKSQRLFVVAAAVGLWAVHAIPALAQQNAPQPLVFGPELPAANSPSANQLLANAIAHNLRQSGQLRHFNVDIAVGTGVVELTGHVADHAQRDEVLRIVQGVPGVERVRDLMLIVGMPAPMATTAMQFVVPEPKPLPQPGPTAFPPPSGGMPAEPMPIFQAPPGMGGPGGAGMPPPPMPPYAWPTYAPYNNYSRVAYPELYPHSAFPFIGPMYPFPKVPLGWRSIQLKWQDGHWWYGRTATGQDWWRVRYW